MNTTLDNSFKPNFSDEYNYDELIKLLSSDNDKEKHFAALELEEIQSQADANLLVSNLVGQDGKIREAVAFKINEFTKNSDFTSFFLKENLYETYALAITDINGNVCRYMIDSMKYIASNKNFKKYICKELPKMINSIWGNIEKLDLSAKQYVVSKRNFQLYWCLEALDIFAKDIEIKKLNLILNNCGNFYDYTIREKIAKIIIKLDYPELTELREKLKNDENYYVRRYLR